MKMTHISAAIALMAWAGLASATDYAPGACSMIPGSRTCVDATPCKTLGNGMQACLLGASLPVGALALNNVCWKYKYEYACEGPAPANTCIPYETNPACAVIKSECTDRRAETGACTSWNYTYKCQTRAQTTESVLSCTSNIFDTSALPTPANPNDSFVKAALAMEIARQSQVYGEGGATTVFNGEVETCTKGYWGIRDCCSGTPGAQSNSSFAKTLTGELITSGAKYLGSQAIDYASPYVFDAMYSSGMFSQGLMTSISTMGNVVADQAGQAAATNFAANGFSMSAYGFTYGTGTFGGSNALAGTINLTDTLGMTQGQGFISFNPYVFAAMLVIQYLQRLSQCEPEEMMFQMHKGANLTHFLKEECSNKILGSCVERKQTHCGFNSVLAKIINVQGKTQLGLNVDNCAGMTIEQVGQIDFKNIDMSEFSGQLLDQAQAGLPNNIKGNYTPVIQGTNKGSIQSASTGTAFPPASVPQLPPFVPPTVTPPTTPVTGLPTPAQPLPGRPTTSIPPGTIFPPGVSVPSGTIILPQNTLIPPGTVLPRGTILMPQGTVLPPGYVLPPGGAKLP